jgi:Regulator of ribonuclease activity B
MGWRDLFKPKPRDEDDLDLDEGDEPVSGGPPEKGDKQVLKQLRRLGANLSRPREVVHFLYFPTQVAAEQASHQLRGEGYMIDVRPAANAADNPPNPWLMEARNYAVVDESNVQAMRQKFEGLAEAGSGEYDGWEAAAD